MSVNNASTHRARSHYTRSVAIRMCIQWSGVHTNIVCINMLLLSRVDVVNTLNGGDTIMS